MKPYTIYLEYLNSFTLENDLLEAKIIHPVLNEYLYAKYLNRIIALIGWRKLKNPPIKFKIINNRSLLLYNGKLVNNNKDGSLTIYDDLANAGWLVDEIQARKDRILVIGGQNE